MFKKLFLGVVTLIATMGFAFADVDVNKADQAALDGIKGIGPKTSKAIIDERKKGGDFKDWNDLEKRVKGIGEKSAVKLSENGLTVNGQSLSKASSTAKEDKKGKKTKAESSKGEQSTAGENKDANAADTKDMKKASKKDEPKK